MASKHPEAVRIWTFGQAPKEFQTPFAGGQESDWVAHVPESERAALEASLLQWQPVYSVRRLELDDRSVIYHGSPQTALERIVEQGRPAAAPSRTTEERRSARRVPLECPSRYRTSERLGYGHTIDISTTGIAFTTQTRLSSNSEITLQIEWPVRLESGVPVELSAVGKLARAEAAMAAMEMASISFSVAG